MSMKRMLRLPEVRQAVGLSRSHLYSLVSRGEFPKPVPIGVRARAWDADEIEQWIRDRITARDKTAA